MMGSRAVLATALFAYGLALAEGISFDSLTLEDGQSLVRIQQLSEWMGSPVALATGLCVERNYGGAWPVSGSNNIKMRTESMLQQAWETCNTTGDGLRLVKQVRELLQGQILRMTQPYAALTRCKAKTVPEIDVQRCLVSAFGRSLVEEEQRALLTSDQHH